MMALLRTAQDGAAAPGRSWNWNWNWNWKNDLKNGIRMDALG